MAIFLPNYQPTMDYLLIFGLVVPGRYINSLTVGIKKVEILGS